MEKVVFALSGFVNPMRSDLRDKALEMGAKYKGDWDSTCTHLVLVFFLFNFQFALFSYFFY